ncbi:MAG: 3-isopropylmalate dehydratase [Chloroflexi bacterium]|nr:3-isopropylmalate dehydratase [Chloroflexota bacterium]
MIRKLEGRTWKFGDNINTDLMIPSFALAEPEEKQPKYCFSANRPGWVDLVKPGDILVAGNNFGTGSSRPGAKVLKSLGIICLLAESINGLFLRNCVNYGLPALPCPGVFSSFNEGDIASVQLEEGKVVNLNSGRVLATTALPNMLLEILAAGGIVPLLEGKGLLDKAR